MFSDTTIAFFLAAFSALFTIINPLGTASIFLTITRNNTAAQRRAMVKKACLTAAIVLFIFAFAGSLILSFFSITVDAFRIAGGIIIALIGYNMVNVQRKRFKTQREEKEAIDKQDVSIVPLAIPLVTGPGAMTTAIVLMGQTESYTEIGAFVIAASLVFLITFLVLYNASKVEKYLSETGRNIIERLLGLIVMVVGVQFVINGLSGILVGWGFI